MSPDVVLTIGLFLGVLSVPSLLSAMADRRSTRASMLSILLAGSCLVWALYNKPGGYALGDVPTTVIEVIASVLR